MKEHFQKIKEGFAGIWKDSIKHCKDLTRKTKPKIQKGWEKTNNFVGTSGWIAIGAVVVIWILLAYYTSKAHMYQQKNQILNFENIGIHRHDNIANEMKQSMRNLQNELIKTHNFQQRRIEIPSKNSSQSVFVSNKGLQHSFVISNGKVSGTILQDDKSLRNKIAVQLQKLGFSVEQRDNQILYQGNASSQLPLLQILN